MKKNRQFLFGLLQVYVGLLLIEKNYEILIIEFKITFLLGLILGLYFIFSGAYKVQKTI
jgi:hypothetical protein